MTTTVGQLPAATSIAATDLIPVEQGGVLKRATPNLLPFTASGTGLIPSTTANTVAAGMAVLDSAGATIRSQLRVQRMATGHGLQQRKAMASPPVVTFGSAAGVYTARTIASPLTWRVTNDIGGTANGITGDYFTFFGCHSITQFGATFPNYHYAVPRDITTALPSTFGQLFTGVAFYHYGAELEISVKGVTGTMYVKIDGEFISLTAQAIPNDGSLSTYYIPFGSTAERRIEVIGYNLFFGGVFTAQTDTIRPAPLRGPRTIVIGDSFAGGTGATNTVIDGFVRYMADYLGWDDVAPSGLGGGGYLVGAATFADRIQHDVIAYSPDVVIVTGGFNDYASKTLAQILAAATSLFSTLQTGLPNALIIVAGPFFSGGVRDFPATGTLLDARDAIKSAATAAGLPFIDLLEIPLPAWTTTVSTTLSANVSAGGASVSLPVKIAPRQHIQIDRERMEVLSVAGVGPFAHTVSGNVAAAHTSGTSVTVVGAPLWTGTGQVGTTTGYGNSDVFVSSDGVHPSTAGHEAIGKQLAQGILSLTFT